MKKKILLITLITLMVMLIGCSSKQAENVCQADECNNLCIIYRIANSKFYGVYCEEHTCIEQDCYSGREIGNNKYCTYHKLKYEQEEQNKIKLSASQITIIREIVDEYCELLISKHSNILAVNIINDIPETSSLYIKYYCNVVRKDSNINPATIYITIEEDGSFKVDNLEYDEE